MHQNKFAHVNCKTHNLFPGKQAQDNAAAWAAYYAQFYNQTPYAQYGQQQPQQQQPQVQQQQPAPNQTCKLSALWKFCVLLLLF